uniref:SRCR domain-containing protein n=1 Tax=Knipowitschia caucasica TaxID=637954 RepID=A0AAV2KRP2_KNICA
MEALQRLVQCNEDSVRLVGGSGLCSGSLQIWDQSWISVCEGALDLRGAEVLCRELGCGDPSVLQGELSPLGQTFHCEGHESALMDCLRSRPKTCSSGRSVGIICSELLRLVGAASRCAGTVELRHRGEWGRVWKDDWTKEDSAALCRDLDCGSAVSGHHRDIFPRSPVWRISSDCTKRKMSKMRECVVDTFPMSSPMNDIEVICSDLLNRPALSLSVTVGISQVQVSQVGVQVVRVQLGSQFLVQCSVKPQFPGGSFQLLSPSGNHTLPAVNHSAHFLFNHTGPAHKGDYTCVYHLQVFNHSFTSESERLELRLGVLNSDLIFRLLVILLMTLLYIMPMYYCYHKTKTRSGARETPENLILRNEARDQRRDQERREEVMDQEVKSGEKRRGTRRGDERDYERRGEGPERRGIEGPAKEERDYRREEESD